MRFHLGGAGVASELTYLHENDIIHADLKSVRLNIYLSVSSAPLNLCVT